MRNTERNSKPAASITVLAISLLGAAAFAQPANVAAIADTEITAEIERQFVRNDAVPFDRIYVTTSDGIVSLTGTVRSLAAREQAEKLAEIVRGVAAIVNRIEIEPGYRSPDDVRSNIAAALEADPATESRDVDFTVDAGGLVILSGVTQSWAERQLAENVVSTVAGVTEVINQIMIDSAAVHRLESEIEREVRARLRWDARVDDSLINVLVLDGGRVMLSGTVGSAAEKREAAALARVAGVADVIADNLNVARWARDEDLRRGKFDDITESGIRTAVIAALRHDPRVDGSKIDVDVDGRDVWLHGEVSYAEAKRSAVQDAYNTVGVRQVVNRIRVIPEALDDDTIESLLSSALRSRDLLDDGGIDVSVTAGRARLTGDVASLAQYWQADQSASSVRGVEALQNDLTVRGTRPQIWTKWYGFYPRPVSPGLVVGNLPLATDREIHANLAREIYWSPFVDAENVSFEVDDGVVTLTGAVGSAREQLAARENAFEAGAVRVRDRLEIAN